MVEGGTRKAVFVEDRSVFGRGGKPRVPLTGTAVEQNVLRGRGAEIKEIEVRARVLKTNFSSDTFLSKLKAKGRFFFGQPKRKEIKVFRVYISLAKRLVLCFFIIIKKNPQQT